MGYGVVRFEDENGNPIKPAKDDVEKFFDYLEEKKKHGKNSENSPRLSEMFFAKFRVEEKCLDEIIGKIEKDIGKSPESILKCNGNKEEIDDEKVINKEEFLKRLKDFYKFIPTSALVRKGLREKIRSKWNNDDLRHFLMGKLGNFSAIQVSHLYWNEENWEFRVWGWVPENIDQRLRLELKENENEKVSRKDIVNYIKQIFNDQNFWQSCLGIDNSCLLQKTEGEIIIEYPKSGWNFIDFKEREHDKVKEAFEKMIG